MILGLSYHHLYNGPPRLVKRIQGIPLIIYYMIPRGGWGGRGHGLGAALVCSAILPWSLALLASPGRRGWWRPGLTWNGSLDLGCPNYKFRGQAIKLAALNTDSRQLGCHAHGPRPPRRGEDPARETYLMKEDSARRRQQERVTHRQNHQDASQSHPG